MFISSPIILAGCMSWKNIIILLDHIQELDAYLVGGDLKQGGIFLGLLHVDTVGGASTYM